MINDQGLELNNDQGKKTQWNNLDEKQYHWERKTRGER